MKVTDHTDRKEVKILADMIGNPTVLGRIAAKWNGKLFKSPASNIVADLAVKHYRKHGNAPCAGINSLFEMWGKGKEDTDNYEYINSFLGSLELSNGECNPDLVLDIAGEHFNEVRASRLIEECSQDLEANRFDKFQERVTNFARVELGVGTGINFLHDEEILKSVFEDTEESMIEYPGDAGLFFQGMLARDSFIAFEAAEKVGKTWMLIDIAWRAIKSRRKVAFFEVGDMSQRQILRRFYCRAAKHPFRSSTGKWPLTVRIPKSITKGEDDLAVVEYQEKVFDGPLTAQKSLKAVKKVLENDIKMNESPIKLASYPASTIDVPGIKNVLDTWELNGWSADVIIIDYADILAPPPGKKEERDQTNTTWTQLRALSQEKHCLVVTATQADAASYGKKTLDRRNFSVDKRKMAHVNGLIGINVIEEEKEKGIMRLNWIVLREGEYSGRKCLHCASCLPLANPCVVSCF